MTPPPPLDVRSLRKQLNPGGMNSAHLMLGFSLVSQNITAYGWVVSKRCASSALLPAAPLQLTISVLQLFFLDCRKSSGWSWFVLCELGWLVLVLQCERTCSGSWGASGHDCFAWPVGGCCVVGAERLSLERQWMISGSGRPGARTRWTGPDETSWRRNFSSSCGWAKGMCCCSYIYSTSRLYCRQLSPGARIPGSRHQRRSYGTRCCSYRSIWLGLTNLLHIHNNHKGRFKWSFMHTAGTVDVIGVIATVIGVAMRRTSLLGSMECS